MTEPNTENERALIDSLRRRLLESTPDLLAIASAEGRFVWLSQSWSTTLGWTCEELMQGPFLDFVHESDRGRTLAEFEAMMNEGRVALQFQNRYRHKDGEYRWLEWNSVVDGSGYTLCVARDITARKEGEVLERERFRQMQMAEDLVGLGHWRVDLKQNRPYWSPKVYEIHGRDPETYVPNLEEAIDAYHPDDRQMVQDYVAAAVEKHADFEFEARVVQPGGDIRWVHSRGVPEVGQDGEVVSLFGVFRDITDARRLEESMRRSERMASIGTMAAGIAHEINNPLSYLLGNLQMLEEDLAELREAGDSEALREMRPMIEDSVAGALRIRKIIDGVRSFTRVEAVKAVPVDVNDAVHAAVSFAEHEIKVRARTALDLQAAASVLVDETQLVQVLVNLLVNAAQALPEGAASEHCITVSTQDEGDFVGIRVADTGPGVPAEIRPVIFDPFFTTKPVGTGTGLGLSICHTIAEQSGGSIELEPTGAGACFHVRFPVAAGEATAPDVAAPAAPVVEGLPSLLVVDDEPQVLTMIRRATQKMFRVETAESGREAIERFVSGRRYDLVLCDLMMPEVTGIDVVERLAECCPE
ncbi:MAG: PAS domain-containing protein, partial [Planctomycetes bacterium]|nr:PAS domain-containing protein [Planctomycetota bacterium]